MVSINRPSWVSSWWSRPVASKVLIRFWRTSGSISYWMVLISRVRCLVLKIVASRWILNSSSTSVGLRMVFLPVSRCFWKMVRSSGVDRVWLIFRAASVGGVNFLSCS